MFKNLSITKIYTFKIVLVTFYIYIVSYQSRHLYSVLDTNPPSVECMKSGEEEQ